jgi:hypothetical protein
VTSDAELAVYAARTDRFVAELHELIAATRFDPVVRDSVVHRRVLERISASLDAVDYGVLTNLATVNVVTRGLILATVRVKLLCAGAAPELDYADAASFLEEFHRPVFDLVKRRH